MMMMLGDVCGLRGRFCLIRVIASVEQYCYSVGRQIEILSPIGHIEKIHYRFIYIHFTVLCSKITTWYGTKVRSKKNAYFEIS